VLLSFTTTHLFRVTPERLFDFTNDAPNFVSFVGFGPIPGIRKATYETVGEPRIGSKRRITKTDGTEHFEELVVFDRPRRHVSRITGLSPPFSWLVRYGEDDWKFMPSNSGTLIERTFAFELTNPLAALPAFPLLHLFMRFAVIRDLRNVERAVHGQIASADR
jgi:ribosome-associated toxin RatA of RatAB toxin-antitoxin module